MNTNHLLKLLTCAVLSAGWLNGQGGWTLQGRIAGLGNEPVGGTRVLVGYLVEAPAQMRSPHPFLDAPAAVKPLDVTASPAVVRAIAGTVMTDGDGKFTLEGVQTGQVVVCVQAAALGYLDPCHWDEKRATFSVTPGKVVNAGTVRIRKGAVLRVRLEDSQGRLTEADGKAVVPVSWMYSTPLGVAYPMRTESVTADAITHTAVLESKKPVKVVLAQTGLTLQDKADKPDKANKKGNELEVLMPDEGKDELIVLKVLKVERKSK